MSSQSEFILQVKLLFMAIVLEQTTFLAAKIRISFKSSVEFYWNKFNIETLNTESTVATFIDLIVQSADGTWQFIFLQYTIETNRDREGRKKDEMMMMKIKIFIRHINKSVRWDSGGSGMAGAGDSALCVCIEPTTLFLSTFNIGHASKLFYIFTHVTYSCFLVSRKRNLYNMYK